MARLELWPLLLLIGLPLGAQTFVTTCAGNACSITVTSGTVTIGPPSPTLPTVTGFSPSSGPSAGGTNVTITGTNFSNVSKVSIGVVNVASFSVASATQISAITAPGTGAGIVTVITAAGTASSTAPFTYVSPPAGAPVSDNFNTAALNTSLWAFVNPVGDGSQAMTGTQLKLTVPGGTNHDPAFGGMDNTVRVMQPVSSADFSVITQFDTTPQASLAYQFEGIIIEQDATHYLRMQLGSTGTTLLCNMDSLIGGVETSGPTLNIASLGQAASLWMGVKKVGSVWSLYYSLDGVQFILVGSMTQALTMTKIGPFAGNYGATSAPAFTALVNSFTNAPMPSAPPTVACNSTVNPGDNVQNAVNAAAVGSTACFADGLFPVPASATFKPGVKYAKVSGTPVIQGTGGYSLLKIQGNDTDISGLTLKGGGIEITGSVARLNIHGNTIGEILSSAGGAAGAGIYQDGLNGQQILDSKFEDNILRNIYGPGELTCNGVFPPNGQPCDYDHNGIIIYNQSNLSVQRNVFQTISGDAFHAFEQISCGELGGPRVPQPGLLVMHNTILDNHRIPIEIQLCGMTNGHTDFNLISGTYQPSAWDIIISLASECTGCTMNGNYIDQAKGQGPGWGIVGTAFETGGTGTAVTNNLMTSALGSSGNAYLGQLSSVMGSNAVFTNNKMCGPAFNTANMIVWEPPCNGGGCAAWSQSNNTIASSCSGFPAPPVVP